MYACGFNEFGELGIPMVDDETSTGNAAVTYKCRKTPVAIDFQPKVRFIAAGKNHSAAVTMTSADGESDTKLYTWGLSSHGQLGHEKVKNSYNISRPKKVKFLEEPNTRIVFISAAERHNLCLDTHGNIWFFGEKQSVGVREFEDIYQFSPRKLQSDRGKNLSS